MRRMLARMLALALLLCVALPLFAKKDREYLDGTLLDENKQIQYTQHIVINDPTQNYLSSERAFFFWVQVGKIVYIGEMKKMAGVVSLIDRGPKKEDWPPNTPVKVRFEKETFLGLRQTFMYLVDKKGKELKLQIKRAVDEDGNNLCGRVLCG